jgi:succinate dehydrogenase/fumarate reductase flavoprotein subunit
MGESMSVDFKRETDVVIVGSGAAALATAILAKDGGCDVEILEVADSIGGTSAVSGGQPWVPCNEHMREAGLDDSPEEALGYVRGLTGGREPDGERLEYFVRHAHEALAYLEANTPLNTSICTTFSDYYANRPGGKMKGRTLEITPFPARDELGELDDRVRRSAHIPALTLDEMAGAEASADPKNATAIAAGTGELSGELMARMAQRDAEGIRTCGGALVTSLLKGAVDRGLSVQTGTRAQRLIVEDGAIVGIVAEADGEEVAIRARRGVVLAAGGFEWNAELVQAFLGVRELWPISPPYNRGDGLLMGLEVGASIANMTMAWGCPVVSDEKDTLDGSPLHIMNTPRQEPGVIVVNGSGRRFSNEAAAYMQYGLAHRAYDTVNVAWPNEAPVWLVFDQVVRDRTAVKDFVPNQPAPDWVKEAATIAELAGLIGVPADELVATVERWNASVDAGADRDFGRGTAWFEGWTSGGPGPHLLAKIEKSSFYAMRLYDGAIGTAGGLRTDERGRVKSMRGPVIDGLYAVGNTAASVFGPAYPGGGATIGQALTFGYLAGRDLAARRAELVAATAGAAA